MPALINPSFPAVDAGGQAGPRWVAR